MRIDLFFLVVTTLYNSVSRLLYIIQFLKMIKVVEQVIIMSKTMQEMRGLKSNCA